MDADWSDLIEISDITRTVYISFDARAATSSKRLQPVVCNVFPCFHFVIIQPSRRRNFWVWSDSTVTHWILLKVNKIKMTVITDRIGPAKLHSIRTAVMH